ncbi:MAG: ATP-binding protein [Acidimicrobiia bacterium]
MAPTFHGVRALTAAVTAAALAILAVTWSTWGLWLVAAVLVVVAVDAFHRRTRRGISPIIPLAVDGAVLVVAVFLIGGPAFVAAPLAFLLTAALILLPLRRALLVLSYLVALLVAVYFSSAANRGDAGQWLLVAGALLVFLGAMGVLLGSAIHGIHSMRRQQEDLIDELRVANEHKNELLASVSHELRTPLTAVAGFAQLLIDGTTEIGPEEREAMIAAIAAEAFEVGGLVEDLLVAARDEVGELTVIQAPVDLRAQVNQILETWHSDDAAIRRLRVSGQGVKALADPARIRQIIRNLVSNAARYGGSDIRIQIEDGDLKVRLRVLDNGDGVPEEHRDTIFAPFFRVNTETSQPGSVGLGLSVSRQLARKMGGDLTYRYQQHQSLFELTLPPGPSVASEEPAAHRHEAELTGATRVE